MFQSVRFARQQNVDPPASAETVIDAMMSQRLDFAPGERYAYSNFGYCLLGRVIEKLTGVSYEEAVRNAVLKPIGAGAMRIGPTRLEGRSEHEVRYYHVSQAESVFAEDLGQQVPSQYGGWYLEAMDSHGGWIASAMDLARFGAALDRPEQSPLLKAETIRLMHERPEGRAGHEEDGTPSETFYSLGWMNRVVGPDRLNHWHTGSLPGTATILIRRHDGVNLVAVMNTRTSPTSAHLGRDIDAALHRAANSVSRWKTPSP
ncbi:MAG: beta-lactamase family protein, partial [Planctomycetaceae bacterium]|nr:beta-lactamase family protein [Planctomycetaceae bacterium]